MAYQWVKVADAVRGAREKAGLTRGELAALADVDQSVIEQLEVLRARGRRRLLNRRYSRIAAIERVLSWPEGRTRSIALGFCDPNASAWKAGDPVSDPFVRDLRRLAITREAADVLTTVYLEDRARERPSGGQ
jgi:hypothetical protein